MRSLSNLFALSQVFLRPTFGARIRNDTRQGDHVEHSVNTTTPRAVHFPFVFAAGTIEQALETRYPGGSWRTSWGASQVESLLSLIVDPTLFEFTWDDNAKIGRTKGGLEIRPSGGFQSFKAALEFAPGLKNLIKRLKSHGYKEGTSLVPHAYVWMYSVQGWAQSSFPILKADIEKAVTACGKRAVLASLSMGGLYFRAFMNWVGPGWVSSHVEALIPYDGPYAGAVQTLQSFIGGYLRETTVPVPTECPSCQPAETLANRPRKSILKKLQGSVLGGVEKPIMDVLTTAPGSYVLFPTVDYSQDTPVDRVVVTTSAGAQYRASQLPSLLRQLGFSDGAKMLEYWQTQRVSTDPGVKVHCILGHGIKTATSLEINEHGDLVKVVEADGDETVDKGGAICHRWSSTVKTYRLLGVGHVDGVVADPVIDILVAVATNDKAAWSSWVPPVYQGKAGKGGKEKSNLSILSMGTGSKGGTPLKLVDTEHLFVKPR